MSLFLKQLVCETFDDDNVDDDDDADDNLFLGNSSSRNHFEAYFQLVLLSEDFTSQSSITTRAGFEPVQNLSSRFVE